ncbi:hypothetical protein Ddye_021671 [Dipteronia dyeriana]|uniref:Uncharacterized protein n=1 Tax=Dipteronia dyeriana TaxID=168575 RepID=A0AAD9U2W9_9ROSI|nr:hypothetical protein Ddye_021671 [Dipteronia dyeriana]
MGFSKLAVADDNKISTWPRRGGDAVEDEKDTGIVYYGPVITFKTTRDMNVFMKANKNFYFVNADHWQNKALLAKNQFARTYNSENYML